MARTFGVEIELVGLSTTQTIRVMTAAGFPVNSNPRLYEHIVSPHWKVLTDQSVDGSGTGEYGCEVVSPILSGEEGLAEVKKVADALAAAGADANQKCGLHVHVSTEGCNLSWIKNICSRYAQYEDEIDAIMPPSRRGSNNDYARTMKRVSLNGETLSQLVSHFPSRSYKVNLKAYERYRTVEFRHHSGTVNASKIINWVRFVMSFFEASKLEETRVTETYEERLSNASLNGEPSGLSRTERRLYGNLVERDHSAQELADRSGLGFESVRSAISRMRRSGCIIKLNNRTNAYHLTVPAPSAAQTVTRTRTRTVPIPSPTKGLWDDVPAEVIQFYSARRVALSQGN